MSRALSASSQAAVGSQMAADEPKGPVTPGALGGIRTPNLLIRSQMLYPLSYERLEYLP
jgi:hypothetical protein